MQHPARPTAKPSAQPSAPVDPSPLAISAVELAAVRGGFGALLGTLAQSAGPILNGVAGIIGASKSGGGGAPAPAGPSQPALAPSDGGSDDPRVSVSIRINGVAVG